MMKALATEKWWFTQLLIMVWANFLFLAFLAVAFGGFFGAPSLSYYFYLFWAYGSTFHLIPFAAAFGYLSSIAWSKAGRQDRASALSLLAGLAMGTYLLALYLANRG